MGLVSKQPEDDEEQGPEVLITGFGDLDGGRRNEVELPLDDWSEAARAALDERMHLLEAAHAWDGTTLVVQESDAAWIERIIEQVEDERVLQLDPEIDQVAYDLDGWDDDNRGLLVHALQDESIAYAIEDGELVVHEIDEARVDELIDGIIEPDGVPTAGEARTEVMGELFVAADRLVHDPRDHAGQRDIRSGADEAAAHTPPYGMEAAWWKDVGERCRALVERFDAGSIEDEPIIEAATALRDVLRPYV